MLRWVKRASVSTLTLAAGLVLLVAFGDLEGVRLRARVDDLRREKAEMREYIRRLSSWRRVAQVDVLAKIDDERGRTMTTLRWQEIASDGTLGEPLVVKVLGSLVYIEGLVLKFEFKSVGEGRPGESASMVMFRRVFGDQQEPDAGAPVNQEGPRVTPVEMGTEQRLWSRFWEMVDDPALAADYGVRVAQVEAPAAPMKPGQVWEVTLDAAGGLNLRRIGSREQRASVIPRGLNCVGRSGGLTPS